MLATLTLLHLGPVVPTLAAPLGPSRCAELAMLQECERLATERPAGEPMALATAANARDRSGRPGGRELLARAQRISRGRR
jgi:hypothetical protein